jgi:hypothetical protein
MSALRISVPGQPLAFHDLGPDNGRSAKTAIGGGTIVRPGPSHDIARMKRHEYRKKHHAREIELQRIRRAAGKR